VVVTIAEQARQRLAPLLEDVVERFDDGSDPAASAFFCSLLVKAHAMQEDIDVASLFFELSTAAFQGFVYSPEQTAALDRLLEVSEQLAFALSVDSDQPH